MVSAPLKIMLLPYVCSSFEGTFPLLYSIILWWRPVLQNTRNRSEHVWNAREWNIITSTIKKILKSMRKTFPSSFPFILDIISPRLPSLCLPVCREAVSRQLSWIPKTFHVSHVRKIGKLLSYSSIIAL